MITFQNQTHGTSTVRFYKIGDTIEPGQLRSIALELCGVAGCDCPLDPIQAGFEIVISAGSAVIREPGAHVFMGHRPRLGSKSVFPAVQDFEPE